jgi:chemotaxis response regulator CheB
MSRIRIRELKNGIILESSTAYVNSLSNDLAFKRRNSKEVAIAINPSRGNSIDTMMLSATDIFGSGTVGLLYAGVRQDGVKGFKTIRKNRGTTILAGRKDYFLPDSNEEVLKRDLVDHILDESDIPSFIGGLF